MSIHPSHAAPSSERGTSDAMGWAMIDQAGEFEFP